MPDKGLRDWWRALSGSRRVIYLILLIAPTVLAWSCFLWIWSMHGGRGFFRVMGNYRTYFLTFGFVWLLIPFIILTIMLVKFRPSFKDRAKVERLLSTAVALLLFIGFAVPITFYAVVESYRIARSGDKAPQLLIADGHGSKGIPNMAVCFWTDKVTQNSLTWGKEGSASSTIRESKPGNQHAFNLTDLTPAARYRYRINDGRQYSFVSPPSDGTIRFATAGDAHQGSGKQGARPGEALTTLSTITRNAGEYDLFIGLGDLAHLGFDDSTWKTMLDSFSPFTTGIPFRPLPGNHETLWDNAHHYQEYLYPDAMKLQSGTRLYYRVDVGPVHFFMIDLEWGTDTFSSEQKKWLESELAKIPAGDWKIVMSHCFYYSSGSFENGWPWYDDQQTIDELAPIFKKYRVDLSIAAHNHHMELLQSNGIPYLIAGSLGGVLDPEPTYVSPSSIWKKFGQFGFLDVTIDGSRASINFRNPEGQLIKSAIYEKGIGLTGQ